MVTLLVRTASGEHRLDLLEGQSVRDALDATDMRVRAACGGTGACGACVVRLIGGEVTPPTVAEYMKISAEDRASGVRLACQLRLKGDAEILLDQPALPSHWRSIPAEDLIPPPGRLPNLERHVYGVAVDLGTTHIRVSLWDRKRGKRIASRRGENPQGVFGADVLNRLDAARASPERTQKLAKLALNAIVQAVRDMLARDIGEVTPMLAEIGEVMVVGNTAMLALLTGTGIEALLDTENWQRGIACQADDPAAWQAGWFMPNARISLPAPVAGFVGSDLLADLLATELTGGPAGAMLLDVGTNTEIALWDGQLLQVTSAPGGPAFEAVGLRHGMPAEFGAIHRVRLDGERRVLDVIGGGEARGFCGSGLADAIAVLLAQGVLNPSGRFVNHPGPEGCLLDPGNPRTAIAGSDVDAFQRAKAATAAAMQVLLDQAGMAWQDLTRLVVCGAFGRHLNIGHAQAIGLLPNIDPALIELNADASLAGCEMALLDAESSAAMAKLLAIVRLQNMSLVIDYDDIFIDQLRLRPMSPWTA